MTKLKTIECERLILRDAAGNSRLELGTNDEDSSVQLTLRDQDGNTSIAIKVSKDGEVYVIQNDGMEERCAEVVDQLRYFLNNRASIRKLI